MNDSMVENGAIVPKRGSSIVKNCFVKFTESTSLHGLKYIGEKGNSKFERSLWIVSILTSIGICGFLIAKVWIKWNEFPVIVTFGETALSVWDIPFPLVTICPFQSILNSSFKYRGSCERNLTDSELFKFQSIGLICNEPYRCLGANFTNDSSIQVMREVGLSPEDYINSGRYNSKYYPSEAFQPILTSSGICYSFNMMNINHIYKKEVINYRSFDMFDIVSDWNLDKGYSKESNASVYPYRVMGTGSRAGLKIILMINRYEIEDQCSGINEGFKIAFSLPNTPPPFRDGYAWINLNYNSIITLEPKMFTTAENLRKYNPEKRQCYFENERNLKFFHTYTQENCEAECFANLSLKICDCVPFYIPRVEGTNICGLLKKRCVAKVEAKVRLQENMREINLNGEEACHCLPACTSLKYVPTLHQLSFNFSKDESTVGLNEFIDITMLQIFFESSHFITSKRSELYGIADFLANCGGLLGVCLGFSILSLVEIIYFIIFRCVCRFKNVKKALNKTN